MFQPSLQTHFNGRVDRETLQRLRAFGFHWCRMDAQGCDAATLLQMVEDVEACELVPLPIVYDLERLRGVPTGLACEWGNEPDGDIAPSTYRRQLDEAVAGAREIGVSLWAPAISNLDKDSLRWLEWVRGAGWPAGLAGITAHRYGDGSFEAPHDGFASRDAEVDALLALCDGLPYMITEFGYPTGGGGFRGRVVQRGLSEDEQAARIAQEWDFWRRRDCRVPFLYQLNDGLNADEGYGIRRYGGDAEHGWKPAAYGVPREDEMDTIPMPTAASVFARADLIEVPGRTGEYGLRYPINAETILSPKASGTHELRDLSYLGAPDETCKVVGNLVYFPSVDGRRFAWRLVE